MGAHKVDNTNLHLALGHIESITWIRSSVQDHFVDITRLKIEHETRETEHEA